MSQSIAVIGAGVAATSVIHWLKILRPLDRIVQFSSENLAPAASLKSTAVAALRGTQRGLSALGDELCAYWDQSDRFYAELKNAGLIESELETWVNDEKEIRRFSHMTEVSQSLIKAKVTPLKIVREKCWLIDPDVFLSSFDQNHLHKISLVKQVTKSSQGWLIKTQEEEIEFARVIFCTGAWQRWMEGFFPFKDLETIKPSQGSYFEWQDQSIAKQSFALSFHGLNLHFRHDIKTLQLGATTIKGSDSFRPSRIHLEEIKKIFNDTIELELDFSRAHIHTGIRSIIKSRRPFAGELDRGLYALNGLYKNGWISAWPLGKSLVESL